jgi:hypothetical protein
VTIVRKAIHHVTAQCDAAGLEDWAYAVHCWWRWCEADLSCTNKARFGAWQIKVMGSSGLDSPWMQMPDTCAL